MWGIPTTKQQQQQHKKTDDKPTSTSNFSSSWLRPGVTGELMWVIGTVCVVGLLVFALLLISKPPQVMVRKNVCMKRIGIVALAAGAIAAALPLRRWIVTL